MLARLVISGGIAACAGCVCCCMATITIRRLDDGVKARLRVRAAQNGRSMEEEARHLTAGLAKQPKRPLNLFESIRRRIEPLGGVELEIPPREPMRDPPTFE
jgi:plasmid stability protein